MTGKMRRLWQNTERYCVLMILCLSLILVFRTLTLPAFGMETEALTEPEALAPASESAGSCTIFIYMCGSNLESKYGLATENIDELLEADLPASTNVVIETGGTSRWWSMEDIASDQLQRYIVHDHQLELISEMDNASMGSAHTFGDFLQWGRENYFADRNILVLWNHGGSSADGVCYDENYGYDCLDRDELVKAFDQAGLPEKFDLICLDTCYMGSLANASLFSDYARYMTASQTIVPGSGMNYRTLAEEAAGSALEKLGKAICDTFMDKCAEDGRGDEAQLSFYDLGVTDAMIEAVDSGAGMLKRVYETTGDSFAFFRAAQMARIAGSGSKSNVIDLMHFVNTMSGLDWEKHRDRIQSLLKKLVPYQVCGVYADLDGVSIFYPLNYNEEQLEKYVLICEARNYSTLLYEIYAVLPDGLIAFADPGSIGKDGTFDIELTEDSQPYIRNIIMRLWQESENIPGIYELLGDTEIDTYVTGLGRSLSDLRVSSRLDGEAYALDGHFLLLRVSSTRLLKIYSAPVCINGADTNYTFVLAESLLGFYQRIIYTMLGTFLDENGLPSRVFEHLKSGDKVGVYSASDEYGENLTMQEEFIVKDDDICPEMIPLPEGKYRCQYIVTDIIGRTTLSDYGIFEIAKENGERTVRLKEILANMEN